MRAHRIKGSVCRILILKTAMRFAAWACIMAIAVLSLIPSEQIAQSGLNSGLNGHVAHVLAYAGTAFLTATAYGERGLYRVISVLFAYAGAMEFLQRFSPGRTSRFEDYMFSGAGVLVGVGALVLLKKLFSNPSAPSRSAGPRISN